MLMFTKLELRLLSYILNNYRKEVMERYLCFCKISPSDPNAKHYKSILSDIDMLNGIIQRNEENEK